MVTDDSTIASPMAVYRDAMTTAIAAELLPGFSEITYKHLSISPKVTFFSGSWLAYLQEAQEKIKELEEIDPLIFSSSLRLIQARKLLLEMPPSRALMFALPTHLIRVYGRLIGRDIAEDMTSEVDRILLGDSSIHNLVRLCEVTVQEAKDFVAKDVYHDANADSDEGKKARAAFIASIWRQINFNDSLQRYLEYIDELEIALHELWVTATVEELT